MPSGDEQKTMGAEEGQLVQSAEMWKWKMLCQPITPATQKVLEAGDSEAQG